MMRIIFLAVSIFWASFVNAGNYESYYQVSLATEPGHMFVLVVLKNLDNEVDTSMASFTLEPGEKLENVKGHKDYPMMRYEYFVEVVEDKGTLFVKTDVTVKNNGTVVYKSKQQLSGFDAH